MSGQKMSYEKYDVSDEAGIREAFLFTIKRNFMNVVKRNLNIIEDMRIEHDIFIKKVSDEISPETLKKLDYFTSEKYNYIRKQVLDIGNDSYRDVENFAAMLEIRFKIARDKE